jgi:hypothetical protein
MKIKSIFVTLVLVISSSILAFGQETPKTMKGTNNSIQDQLVAMEKQAWEAWKNKNGNYFQTFLSEDSIQVGADGVSNKSQMVKDISGSSCDVRSYSMDNFQVIMTDKKTAILTYKAMQDATCGGKTAPASVWATSMYVKRGDKWVSNFHQETPTQ